MKRSGSILIVLGLFLIVAFSACGPSSGALGTLPPATPGASVDTGLDLTPGPSAVPSRLIWLWNHGPIRRKFLSFAVSFGSTAR